MKNVTTIGAMIMSLIIMTAPIHAQKNFWETIAGPLGGQIGSIVKAQNGNLFVCGMNDYFCSTDIGKSWKSMNAGNYNLGGQFVPSAINTHGTFCAIDAGAGALYRTTDLGGQWDLISAFGQTRVSYIAVDKNDCFIAGVPGSLYRSSDEGNTWSKLNWTVTGAGFSSISCDANNNLYAATTSNGVYRSTDTGKSWSQYAPMNYINKILFAPNGSIFMHSERESGNAFCIYRSTNNGADWSKVLEIQTDAVSMPAFDMDSNGRLFFAQDPSVLSSTDNGNTWTPISTFPKNQSLNSLLCVSDDVLFVGTEFDGIAVSKDKGQSWEMMGIEHADVIQAACAQSKIVYVATNGGIYRSTNEGDDWTFLINSPLPVAIGPYQYNGLSVDSHGNVFVASREGVMKSSDQGNTWINMFAKGNLSCLDVGALDEILSVCRVDTLLFMSTDGGTTWTHSKIPLSSIPLRYGAQSDIYGNIYVISGTQLVMSSDGGTTWPVSNGDGLSIVVHPDGDLFAGCQISGVQRSSDHGATWVQSLSGTVHEIVSMAVDTAGNIYAATSRDGVYISNDNGKSWVQNNSGLSDTYWMNVSASPSGQVFAISNVFSIARIRVDKPGSPHITSTANTTARAEVAYSYTVVAKGFPDPVFSLVKKPAGMTIDSVSGIITWTPSDAQVGNNDVQARATNSFGYDDQSFTIDVQPPFTAPKITCKVDSVAYARSAYSYQVTASGLPAPHFKLTTKPTSMTIDSITGIISWTPTDTQVGKQYGTVRATNNLGYDQLAFTITVQPANAPPKITSNADTIAVAQTAYSYQVAASGRPTPGFHLTTSPGGMTIDTTSGLLTWTPQRSQFGSHAVTITATNGSGSDAQSFTIVVYTTPDLQSIANQKVKSDTAFQYTAVADAYPAATFSLDTSPTGMTIGASSGVINWTPAKAQAGTHSVQVRATNPYGNVQRSFSIIVDTASLGVGRIAQPLWFSIGQSYPNPVYVSQGEALVIPITAARPVRIHARIFDEKGMMLHESSEQIIEAGRHELRFDLYHSPSGIYFCSLEEPGGKGYAITFVVVK